MSENLFMKAMSKTASVYWHDSGKLSEIDEAISNGAVSITLNPFLTYSALESDLLMWREKASEISENYSGDKKAEELTKLVVGYYAEKLRPFYESGKPGEGYVCAQVNPGKCGDAEGMIARGEDGFLVVHGRFSFASKGRSAPFLWTLVYSRQAKSARKNNSGG